MKQYVISLALLIAALVALPTSNANAQSQAEMNRQAAKDFEKVDAELNSVYLATWMLKKPSGCHRKPRRSVKPTTNGLPRK